MLPFTRQAFLDVFASYNDAIWPAQIVAYGLGLAAVLLLFRPSALSNRVILGILALMWLWTGLGYHVRFFAGINRPAFLFGALFVIEALVLAWCGLRTGRLNFGFNGSLPAWAGAGLVLYAAVIYPLLGMATGHAYPALPMFGVTPCPVTLFTFGLFLLTTSRVPRVALVIPFAWSLVGGSAAILLGVEPDWLLLVSGVLTWVLLAVRDHRSSASRPLHA
jgi:hypothetical protein